MKTKFILVVPTIREDSYKDFISTWEKDIKNSEVLTIVIEDHKDREFDASYKNLPIKHFTWTDIKNDLGKNEWIIPRKNAGIRNYGVLKALEHNPEMIVSLDDDCYPDQGKFFEQHWKYLNAPATLGWVTTTGEPTRGFPYEIREKSEVVLNHGLWSGVPDYDGITLKNEGFRPYKVWKNHSTIISRYNYFSFCSMNFAFKPKIANLMYLPLMGYDLYGNKWEYDRFDDIWGGIMIKKVLDHLGFAVRNGSPSVEHRKASNIEKTVVQEKSGLPVNEWFWKHINAIDLKSNNIKGCYLEIARNLKSWERDYFKKLGKAMAIWTKLVNA